MCKDHRAEYQACFRRRKMVGTERQGVEQEEVKSQGNGGPDHVEASRTFEGF